MTDRSQKRSQRTTAVSKKVKMPSDSGRKKAAEWSEVDILDNEKQKAACKYCNQIISAKIERVRTHIQKCPKRRDHHRGKAGELLRIVRILFCLRGGLPSRRKIHQLETFTLYSDYGCKYLVNI